MNTVVFHRLYQTIRNEQFHTMQTDPLLFGIERAEFEKQKLKRLIAAAEASNLKSIQSKVLAWQRVINRLDATQQRLQTRRNEISRATL